MFKTIMSLNTSYVSQLLGDDIGQILPGQTAFTGI